MVASMDTMIAHRPMEGGDLNLCLQLESNLEADMPMMPQSQSLPTSGTDILSTQSRPLAGAVMQTSGATSQSPKLSINTGTILSSVRESLRTTSECSSSSRPITPVQEIQHLDFVVIPSEAVSVSQVLSHSTLTATTISQLSTTTETTPSGTTCTMSERSEVEQETDVFQTGEGTVDLEPYRYGVMSARRRSVQFYTLLEVDETEDVSISVADQDGDKTVSKKQIPMYKPIFSIGEGLRKLCSPKIQKTPLPRVEDIKSEEQAPSSCGYKSDPEECVRLYNQVHNQQKSLKKIRSNPCIDDMYREVNSQEVRVEQVRPAYGHARSKSLPVTPKVSPKLRRKNTISETEKKTIMDAEEVKKSAGFSFLASVAGELNRREKGRLQERKQFPEVKDNREKGVVAVAQSQVVGSTAGTTTTTVVKTNSCNTSSDKTESNSAKSLNTTNVSGVDNPQEMVVPKKEKQPFFKSIVSWGTTSKVKVSNKETNMFSPTSF